MVWSYEESKSQISEILPGHGLWHYCSLAVSNFLSVTVISEAGLQFLEASALSDFSVGKGF